jgi:hypothetical protein
MVRIPQVGEPPYNEPDKLIAKFPNQPISFKGFVPEKEYLLHIPPKYKDIPGYRLSGQPVKIKLFDALSRTKYQIYVILPSEDGKGIYLEGHYYPHPWIGVSPNWLSSIPGTQACNCPTQMLMTSGCQCGGN